MASEGRNGDADVWRIDKRISVEIVVLVLLQSIAFTWFMSKQDSRIEVQEEATKTNATAIISMQASNTNVIERLVRLEEQMRQVTTTVNRIDRKLPTFKELDEQEQR